MISADLRFLNNQIEPVTLQQVQYNQIGEI